MAPRSSVVYIKSAETARNGKIISFNIANEFSVLQMAGYVIMYRIYSNTAYSLCR